MFERFTDRARRVVVLAQQEARILQHNYIGTEHLLLGLIREGNGVAAKALEGLGISLEAVRQQVEEMIGEGQEAPAGHIPFTPRAKKVLELSLREALQLGHDYIGTEHILLGLIREGEGVAAQVLVRLGADLDRVREQVVQLLHGYRAARTQSATAGAAGSASAGVAGSASAGAPGAKASAAPSPGVGRTERQLARLLLRIKGIESRLAAIELRLGEGPDLSHLDERIAATATEKRLSVEAELYEHAAALRDTERELRAERAELSSDWARTHPTLSALAEEVMRLGDEVARLGAADTEAAQDEALEEFDEEPGPPLDDSSASASPSPPSPSPPSPSPPSPSPPSPSPPSPSPPSPSPSSPSPSSPSPSSPASSVEGDAASVKDEGDESVEEASAEDDAVSAEDDSRSAEDDAVSAEDEAHAQVEDEAGAPGDSASEGGAG